MELFDSIANALSAWLDKAWFGLDGGARLMLMLGLFGQMLFVSRWFVQWLASEKARRSIVPELFWYLSFFGGALVLTYGIYTANLVLMLGQFGVFIYARNIYLIWRAKREGEHDAAPDPPTKNMPAE